MTAEIGILNKNGVVLASDSAVTLSDGKNSKVPENYLLYQKNIPLES